MQSTDWIRLITCYVEPRERSLDGREDCTSVECRFNNKKVLKRHEGLNRFGGEVPSPL